MPINIAQQRIPYSKAFEKATSDKNVKNLDFAGLETKMRGLVKTELIKMQKMGKKKAGSKKAGSKKDPRKKKKSKKTAIKPVSPKLNKGQFVPPTGFDANGRLDLKQDEKDNWFVERGDKTTRVELLCPKGSKGKLIDKKRMGCELQ